MSDAPVGPDSTPAIPSPKPLDPEAAFRAEIGAARDLARVQKELWQAMCAGSEASALEPIIERQAIAIETASRAARSRAHHFQKPGDFDQWIERTRPKHAEELRTLADEAKQLKRQIERDAAQSTYLARKTAVWFEEQRNWFVDQVTKEVGPSTYDRGAQRDSGGGESMASKLDRAV